MSNNIKVAYITGPYRGTKEHVDANISIAKRAAKTLWQQGYAVICPHSNAGSVAADVIDDETILRGLLEILKRCDVVVVLRGWENSEGSQRELRVAIHNGKTILLMPDVFKPPVVPSQSAQARMTATLYPAGMPPHPCNNCGRDWVADRLTRCSDTCKELPQWRTNAALGLI